MGNLIRAFGDNLMSFYQINKNRIVFIFICVWLVFEFFLIKGIEFLTVNYYSYAKIGVIGLYLILFLLYYIFVSKFSYGLILKKFLTNAIGFNGLSLIFIVAFTIQLTCFFDLGYQFLFNVGLEGTSRWLFMAKIGISLLSILVINIIFPSRKEKNEIDWTKRKILITPLSCSKNGITKGNLELFLKPFGDIYINDKTQKKLDLNDIVVLVSKEILNANLDRTCADILGVDETFIDNYNQNQYHSLDNMRKVLLNSIVNKRGQNESKAPTISFSELIDFEDFDKVYMETTKQLKEHEKNGTNQTVIHITPGTKITTGVLTALSLRGDRITLYTSQNTSDNKVIASNINRNTVSELLNDLWDEMDK